MNAPHRLALGTACCIAAACIAGCASTGSASASRRADDAPVGCLTRTGNRIPDASPGCTVVGHTYSHSDITNTGETTVAGALGRLDPTITIQR